MSDLLRRLSYEVAYRVGFAPWDSGEPAPMVVEAVEGPARLRPGRALDLGCGTGRNSIYLARRGWEVTGVDMVGHALGTARRRAAAAGVSVRMIQGDVTRLDELHVAGGYTLLVDAACYHVVPAGRRDAYAASVTGAAAPGAVLLMFGITGAGVPGVGVTAAELRRRFPGWRLVSAAPVPAGDMRQYVRESALTRTALEWSPFEAWRYRLRRSRARRASRLSTAASSPPDT